MNFSVELKVSEELKRALDPKNVILAARQTLNRAVSSGKSIASKEIRKEYNLKAGDLTPRLKVTTAKISNLTATIEISGKPMSLSYFGAKQVTGSRIISRKGADLVSAKNRTRNRGPMPIGVTEQVKPGRTVFIKKAFLAKMKSGHIGVFYRKGKGRGIVEKNVVTIPSMAQNANVMPKVLAGIEEVLRVELPRQLAYYRSRQS